MQGYSDADYVRDKVERKITRGGRHFITNTKIGFYISFGKFFIDSTTDVEAGDVESS